ncbi:AraC family transcriptional regulator [Pseudomonas sp. NPDC090202]|uniref:helix-turn-helix transcriptional regulator n=1 Tax=unclassified Pseudomonas TaxID=196821 RepID=UPI0037F65F84
MTPLIDIRTYHGECAAHDHGFAQIVLPAQGCMDIEVEGQGARLDLFTAALVNPGARHAQSAQAASRFLVLDCPVEWFEQAGLGQRSYVPISASTRKLIEYADLLGKPALATSTAQLTPLLLGGLARDLGQRLVGMDVLLAQVAANPGGHWSNDTMARIAGMSLSRFNIRFAERFQQTPQAWLTDLRMQQARQWLAHSNLPLADIALKVGFSDQAALTRAMSRLCNTTPVAYRRHTRASR